MIMTSKKKIPPGDICFNCGEQSFSNSVCIHKIIRYLNPNSSEEAKAKLNLVFKRIFTELNSVSNANSETMSALEFMINDFVDNIHNQSETEKRLLEDFDRFVEDFRNEDDEYLNDIY